MRWAFARAPKRPHKETDRMDDFAPKPRHRLLEALSERVLLCDGGIGSRVQAMDLDVERDYCGHENCTEVLSLSRPDMMRDIHIDYLKAGSDIIQTNSFGGSPITLAEFDELGTRAFEINRRAGELAREAIDSMQDGRERFVLGSIGPGTKLPSLGHIEYDPLEAALQLQASGLLAGGVDGFLIETCQDPLQIKAAVNGVKGARRAADSNVPIFVQITVETTGTLLVGTDIGAAATIIDALDVDLIGMNCATGPQEMVENIRFLSRNWPRLISVQPNAGLPELVDGQTRYPLAPSDLALWLERFVSEDGINMIGGCCGTTPDHIRALDQMLRGLAGGGLRPKPAVRRPLWVPSVASLYSQTNYRQENAVFSIGERCNANGSKRWRLLQEAHDWEGCVEMAREQTKEGSNALDLCTAFVGRDEKAEMNEVVTRVTASVNAPLVIDSTETPIIEAALKRHGGKAIINSINFEDGESHAADRLKLARKFGCGVIALTIDEEGMAKTAQRKFEVAARLVDFACTKHGLPQSDLMIDPLTFTIATGSEDDRKLGLETLEGIKLIHQAFPEVQIILGLSNISFGLNPAARHVLNSVYLDHAVKAGMTGAILHISKIAPLHRIPEEEVRVAEDLIYDRRREGYDPLQALLALFQDRKTEDKVARVRSDKVEERLTQRIVDGDRKGLDIDLDEAMKTYPPLDIINTMLLDGMKIVGELFGAGKMQLPFVLQSAETMKAAVAWLEPHMTRVAGQEKGTIVLATVKGDVHDIGKNLVDIILTNNGYRVVNLGIKQPIANIVSAVREHRADAIGMSGLLVKSTVVMRENLETLALEGITTPVLLGGAALTRAYVEEDCAAAYEGGRVAYARDAFDGLALMDKVKSGAFDDYVSALETQRRGKPSNRKRRLGEATDAAPKGLDKAAATARRRRLSEGVEVPTPPFWGPRLMEQVNPRALVPYVNERSLFQFQWGFRKAGRSLEEFLAWARQELRPVFRSVLERCEAENILDPKAVYGYWKAASEGDDVIVFDEAGTTELGRFTLPRQAREDGQCVADFFRDVDTGERDVIAFQAVTVGSRVSEVAREWFEANNYQDYLYLHGVGVELAEALAEFVHKRIRAELGFAGDDARDITDLLSQEYRGSRYSFGYPACPRLEDQELIFKLLGADRIGLTLSDEFQIEPEQSTSALVTLHPMAKYFSV